jgi:dTDP-4-amino-4,6-dideoxygalactose transaminase/intein/homing endonuclease
MNIPLSKPWVTEEDIKAVEEVLRTPYLSLGPKLKEFESMLAGIAKRKYAVAANSGTSALHLIIRSLGIKDGDEVITTPFSFVASSNCVLFERAKPVFVDIDPKTYNINPDLIEERITEKTKAILAVDVFGQPADWDKLTVIAKKHNLYLIEDSAEAIGSEYKGRPAGSFGVASVFAFYPNKQLTSVTYDTPVLIREKGVTKLVKIGELMDFMIDNYWTPEGYECLSFNQNGEVVWGKIDTFIKHEIHSELLKITLEKGREVEITKSHSVFTVKDGKIREVLGRNLKEGDYLLVPRRLPSTLKPIEKIDILDYINKGNVKYNNNKVILKSNGVGGGGGKYVNRYLNVDKKLCKLLGYFVAEGSYDTGGGLRFTFGLNEKDTYVKEVTELCKSIWPNYEVSVIPDEKMHSVSVMCGGILHSELFYNLGCGKDVYDKGIPYIIWDTSYENKMAFIEGLMNGDGHRRSINGTKSQKLKVASEKLANGLHYLLLTMGIQSRMEKEDYYTKNGKLSHSYTCEILGFENQKTSKENCIPKEFLSLKENSTSVQKKRLRDKNSVSVAVLERWTNENSIECPDFLLKDLTVLKIKKIEKRKFHGFVYDFEVKGLQNFVGGYGAICLHNTGEGGVLLTDDENIYKLSRSMRNQGRGEDESWLHHTRLGYNYRISDINCALGISQLKRLEKIIEMRDNVAKIYTQKLSEIDEIITPYVHPDTTKMSWFVYVIRLADRFGNVHRDQIIKELGNRQIQTRNYFEAIHLEPFYVEQFGYKKGDFPVTEFVSERTIALPFYTTISEEEIDYVVKNLKEVILEVKNS